jgi:lysophospholipase L1-like esterase
MPRLTLVVLLPALAGAAAFAQSGFYLKSGDGVVFYGDSITEQRLYGLFTEMFVVTRFPSLHVTFTYSGWSGDHVTGGVGGTIDQRLERDVFPYRPTVVTVMLGMNDGNFSPFDQAAYDIYSHGYEHIVQSLKAHLPGVRITAIEPSPYDDVTRPPKFPGGYNAVLLRYARFVRELAEREHLQDADLNTSVVEALRRANQTDPKHAAELISDRVHPGVAGHLLLSKALLKAWNAPSLVSSVTIDAAAGRLTDSRRASVTNLKHDGSLKWDSLESSLPLALDAKEKDDLIRLALDSSNYVAELDREELKITGLTPGRYVLKIDGGIAGSYDAEDLAKGVNLATADTPMLRQAFDVMGFVYRHCEIHDFRWRTLQVTMANDTYPSKAKAMADLDRLDSEIVARERATAQPKIHHFELVGASTQGHAAVAAFLQG